MNRTSIIVLEDNEDRMRAFESAVAQLGAHHQLRHWRDAHRMIAECHAALPDAALISLDHDLNKEKDDSPDPGDGVDVAEFLGRLPPLCPVIIHTSNAERFWSMHNAFRLAGWQAERVIPLGEDWITRSWLPMARSLLDKAHARQGAFYQPAAVPDRNERFSR